MAEKKQKLTPKQEMFVKEYLVDLNATQAAIRAGYSEKTANRIGPQLLVKTCVQDALRKAMAEREKRTGITADMVVEELAKIGRANIKDFLTFKTVQTIVDYTDDGKPIIGYAHVVDLKDSDEVDGSLISEVQLKDGQLKFKLHDKMKALELLGRHLGMFTDNLNHTGDVRVVFNIPRPPKEPPPDTEPEPEE